MSIPTAPSFPIDAADVFLYKGTGWISELIKKFDGTAYSHAAIYLNGQAPNPDKTVVEALPAGVTDSRLSDTRASCDGILVRRYCDTGVSLDPVIAKARDYLAQHGRYAYEQDLLLAFLGLSRQLTHKASFGWLLRAILDRAANFLLHLVPLHDTKEAMICSELVYRCYKEAGVPIIIEGATQPLRAFAGGIGAAEERTWGRGIESGSILDFMVANPAYQPRLEAEAPPAQENLLADEPATYDDAIQAYLHDIDDPTVPEVSPETIVDHTFAALHQFTAALAQVSVNPTLEGFLEDAPSRFDKLTTVIENFVTPGDLSKTTSLGDIGSW